MAEKFPVNMNRPPRTIPEAMAIIDFQCGDEWAGLTSTYVNANTDVAIQILEQHGMVGSLSEQGRAWIHRYLWED